MFRFIPRHAATPLKIALALCLSLGGATSAFAQEIIPIASIQSNPSAYLDSFVTVQGQVTIPSNYIPVGAQSGWIQDDSGRGIHLFGSGASNIALRDTGNIVQLRGEVKLSGTTLGLTNITDLSTQSSGNPRKTSIQVSTGMASDTSLGGAFLQTNGTILFRTSQAPGVPGSTMSLTAPASSKCACHWR